MWRRLLFLIPVLICMLQACEEPPVFPDKPHIELTQVALNDSVLDRLDSIHINEGQVIQLQFLLQDGDGDIGYDTRDTSQCNVCELNIDSLDNCIYHPTFSMFVIDGKDDCLLDPLTLPLVSFNNESQVIDGIIDVDLAGLICRIDFNNPRDKDTTDLSIFLRDRAGNLSDTVTIPRVYLKCN